MPSEGENKDAFNPRGPQPERQHEVSQFDPRAQVHADLQQVSQEKQWQKSFDDHGSAKRLGIKLIAGTSLFIILAMGAAFAWYKFKSSAFAAERVVVGLEGAMDVSSNQAIQYAIRFKNDNRVDLQNARVSLNYDTNFIPEEINGLKIENAQNSFVDVGTIKANSEGEVNIKGRFYAPESSIVYIDLKLSYQPSNFSSNFEATDQASINITTAPIFLEALAPIELADGNEIEYLIKYQNPSTRTFENLEVRAEYSSGFDFNYSEPSPAGGNNSWFLGNLEPGKEGTILIRGRINGQKGEHKSIRVSIGYLGDDGAYVTYSHKETITRISSPVLAVVQNGSNTIDAGKSAEYKIAYQNNGQIGLRNLVVTIKIDSQVVDYSSINRGFGHFDSASRTITLKAADVPGLSLVGAGKGGMFEFSLPTLANLDVKNQEDSNFTIKTTAQIDSPDIPSPIGSNKIIVSNEKTVKINTEVTFDVKAYFEDESVKNSGPIPPKVGEETTFSIHWKVGNKYNKLSGAKISAFLPTGIIWKGVIGPESEKKNLSFNDRTHLLEWKLGDLNSGLGLLEPEREIIFQVGLIPEINQVGSCPQLIEEAKMIGDDSFTQKHFEIKGSGKTTQLGEGSCNERIRVIGS